MIVGNCISTEYILLGQPTVALHQLSDCLDFEPEHKLKAVLWNNTAEAHFCGGNYTQCYEAAQQVHDLVLSCLNLTCRLLNLPSHAEQLI